MKIRTILVALTLFLSNSALADLQLFKDFELSETVTSMTTVKVDAGKGGAYLEGLQQTWAAANELAKELGHIEDYAIYTSHLPESGDFNIVLIVNYKTLADHAPNKADYDEFMKKWGEKRVEQNREISQNYPELREIVGEYLLSRVVFK